MLTSTFQGQVEQSCLSCGMCHKTFACRSWFSTLWCSLQHLVSLSWLGFHLCVYFPWMITIWLLFPVGCDSVWCFSFLPELSSLFLLLWMLPPLLSHLWSHSFPDSHSLAVTVDWTVWILLLPKCPRLDCLTWCTGLYLWLKFLILRIWWCKRNDCICIFSLDGIIEILLKYITTCFLSRFCS